LNKRLLAMTVLQAFSDNKVVIAQLGIGPDGHTAGILPNSVATEPNSRLVVNYVADPYKRLTLSFTALKKVTVAYVLAFGSNKMDALIALQSQNLSLSEQPAQILKQLNEAYVYNDQVGES
jgi:6-phosphogluconolactonase/glucosamine-6-phosphate isomerase/deaminase